MAFGDGNLKRGDVLIHQDLTKTVKSYHWVYHWVEDPEDKFWGEVLVVEFTDGTNTGLEGLAKIRGLNPDPN